MKSFLIGAATSDSGKTTFTMGMLRALKNHGYHTQPFKCGPDYIDTCSITSPQAKKASTSTLS